MFAALGLLRSAGGAPPVEIGDISFIANATSNVSTITIPVSAQAGDLAIMVSATELTPPTVVGWTLHSNSLGNSNIYSKYLTAGEPGSSLDVTVDNAVNIMMVFRSSDASAITEKSHSFSDTNKVTVAQVVPSGSSSSRLIVIGANLATRLGAVTLDLSDTFDGTYSDSDANTELAMIVGYKIMNTSQVDFTVGSSLNWRRNTTVGAYYEPS